MKKLIPFVLIFCLYGSWVFAQNNTGVTKSSLVIKQTDANTNKIRKEGLENSNVMNFAFYLTTKHS